MGLAGSDALGAEPGAIHDNAAARTTSSSKHDLNLVVGPKREHILASSVVLRLASPVFDAMLSPPWMESQGLSTEDGSIKEIELPEDDATAMRFICAVLHHENDAEILNTASSRVHLHVAILTDKYNLHRALKFILKEIMSAAQRLTPFDEDGYPRCDLGYMAYQPRLDYAAAAYVLNDCISFSRLAFALMVAYEPPFSTLTDEDPEIMSSIFPPRFFGEAHPLPALLPLPTLSPLKPLFELFLIRNSPASRTSASIPNANIGFTTAPQNAGKGREDV